MVPRSKEAEPIRRAEGYIDAGIEVEISIDGRAALGEEAKRERPAVEDNVVFQKVTQIRAPHLFGVVGRTTVAIFPLSTALNGVLAGDDHPLVLCQNVAEVGGVDALLAEFRPHRRASQRPLRPGVETEGEYIAAVEVFGRMGVADELEMVSAARP